MNSYKNLVVFDLTSYGSALAIINYFVDDIDIKVFEVSPIGPSALLILMTKENMAAELLKNQVQQQWGQSIICSSVIQNSHADLLPTYLSQNKTTVLKNFLVIETSSVANGLSAANLILESNIQLVDLRVVRSFPLNCVLIATANTVESLVVFKEQNLNLRTTIISDVQPALKSYFEVLQ